MHDEDPHARGVYRLRDTDGMAQTGGLRPAHPSQGSQLTSTTPHLTTRLHHATPHHLPPTAPHQPALPRRTSPPTNTTPPPPPFTSLRTTTSPYAPPSSSIWERVESSGWVGQTGYDVAENTWHDVWAGRMCVDGVWWGVRCHGTTHGVTLYEPCGG